MFVIFEGLDKAGKGTLEWEFLKATNFKHVVIDRGPAGYMTFDVIFKRNTFSGDVQFSHDAAVMMKSNDCVVVYCKAPFSVVKERLKEHNEECPYDYERAQDIYDINVHLMYDEKKVIVVDTTRSIEECVDIIKRKVEGDFGK